MSPAVASAKLLVTGGGGFVGTRLIAALRAKRPDLRVIAPPGPEVGAAGLDVADPAAMEHTVAEAVPDAVIHLAAVAAVTDSEKDPRRAWRVNLDGTLNLVTALRRHSPRARLLHVSSGEVYGASAAEGEPLDERALLQPLNPYAASKAAADLLVRQEAANGLPAVVMRPFNQVGPGQSPAFAMPSFARQIARIEAGLQAPTLTVGALDEARDFLAVDDVIDAYMETLGADVFGGEAFNVASGRALRIGDMLDRLLSMSSARIEVRVDPHRLRRAPLAVIVGDAAKLRQAVGWTPRRAVDDMLAAVLDHERLRITDG